jgi:hypothetical protein
VNLETAVSFYANLPSVFLENRRETVEEQNAYAAYCDSVAEHDSAARKYNTAWNNAGSAKRRAEAATVALDAASAAKHAAEAAYRTAEAQATADAWNAALTYALGDGSNDGATA